MMTRPLLVCLVALGLAFSGGCACGPHLGAPFGPGTLCDPGGSCGPAACGSACGPTCDSSCGGSCGGSCGSAPAPMPGPACSTCGEVCGGACGSACGDPCCVPDGPLTWLFDFLYQGYCGDGCGEIWWGDWHGAPPDCCDPCDRCGNYTGRAGVTGGADAYGGSGACESCGQGPSGHVHRVGATETAEPRVVAAHYVARSIPQNELPRQQPANQ